MKKILIIMVGIAFFYSCSEHPDCYDCDTATATEIEITVGLPHGVETRAFPESYAKEKTWEREVKTLRLFFYDQRGNFAGEYNIGKTLIDQGTFTIVLPPGVSGTRCTVYALANTVNYVRRAESSLLMSQADNTHYQPQTVTGTFEMTTTGSVRQDGFWMSDWQVLEIKPSGQKTELHLELTRILAKAVLQINLADDFPGSWSNIRIKRVICSTVLYQKLFAGTDPVPYPLGVGYYQIPAFQRSYYVNVFYLTEYETSNHKGYATLKIEATHDADGDLNTTDDQTDINWIVPVNAAGDQSVIRNHCYRTTVEIRDKEKIVVTSNAVLPWVELPDQGIEVGH